MADRNSYIRMALAMEALRAPLLRSAIEALMLPVGSRGLDAGCGIGLQALMLAESVGPEGHVTGLDLSPEVLAYGEDLVREAGMADRISFREGDVRRLPFDEDAFDWAWSVDCVGYAPMDPLPLIEELARVVKPGGHVAILAWSSQKLLPGYPLLEARLEATTSGIAPFAKGSKPESHFLRLLGWFREIGLEDRKARTFAGCAHAPLSDDLRVALEALVEMRWPGVRTELLGQVDGEALWAEYERLCLPDSPDFILNHPDYVAFFTYTMFWGRCR